MKKDGGHIPNSKMEQKSNLVIRNNFHLRSLFALEYITNKTIGLLNVIKLCISDSAIPISWHIRT